MLLRTSSESYLRPIRRLTAKTVASGLVMACRLAIWPTSRSPASVNPTIEGVVRLPSELGITTGSPPSMTATQLLVVPRSIPITLGMKKTLPRRAVERQQSCAPRSKIRTRREGFGQAPAGGTPPPPDSGVRGFATTTAAGRTSRSFNL